MVKKILIILLSFFFLLNNVYSLASDSNLTAHYKLDDLSDSTGLNSNLTNNGATLISSGCFNGSCYDFEKGETDYISTNTLFPASSEFTVSCTIKVESSIVNQDCVGQNVAFAMRFSGTNIVQFYLHNGVSYSSVQGSTTLSDGVWYQLTGVFTGTQIKVYVNGVEDATPTSITTMGTGSENANIGLLALASSTHADGLIDEVSIWNRALNDSEVLDLYNNGITYFVGQTPSITHNISEYYKTENISIQLNTTILTNMSYSLNDAMEISICNNCLGSVLNLTNLIETSHNLTLISTNSFGQINTSVNFTIDLTKPTISISNITEINSYDVNFSSLVSCSDLNLFSCNVTTDEGNILSAYSMSYNFSSNGNHTFNVTGLDLAGNLNTSSGTLFINPYFYVYFEDENSTPVTDFNISGVPYSNYFSGKIYDYGFGVHLFNFSKSGFADFQFSLNLTNTSDINITFTTALVYVNVFVREITNNSLVDNQNYTILFYNIDDDISQTFYIVNGNNYSIPNYYATTKNTKLNLVDDQGRVLTNKKLIAPREDINVTFYVASSHNLSLRSVRVLNPSLIPQSNVDVDFYVYLQSTGEFVLTNTIETDGLGLAYNYIVPSEFIYNICNTYQGSQKCLNQIIFAQESIQTPDYDLIHLSGLTGDVRNILSFINWTPEEIKTNTTSKMSFYFNDRSQNTERFCLNVSRTTNNVKTHLGSFCSSTPSGAIVQTFGLVEGQYLDYSFIYTYDGEDILLYKFRSYAENPDVSNLSEYLDLIFFILFFGLAGYLINTNNFDIYFVGMSLFLLAVLSVQAVLNGSWAEPFLWGFMTTKSLLIYYVRND